MKGEHLAVAPDVLEDLKSRATRIASEPVPYLAPGASGSLFGIPVVLDESLPPNGFELRERRQPPPPHEVSIAVAYIDRLLGGSHD